MPRPLDRTSPLQLANANLLKFLFPLNQHTIFMLLILGIIEFGRAMMVSQLVTNAARDGARTGARRGATEAEVITAVEEFLNESMNIQASDLSIEVAVEAGPNNPTPDTLENASPGDKCTVTVTLPFGSVALLPADYLSKSNLRGFCAMRREW